MITSVVLYECLPWSLILREELWLKCSRIVLREMLVPKREEVTGELNQL